MGTLPNNDPKIRLVVGRAEAMSVIIMFLIEVFALILLKIEYKGGFGRLSRMMVLAPESFN